MMPVSRSDGTSQSIRALRVQASPPTSVHAGRGIVVRAQHAGYGRGVVTIEVDDWYHPKDLCQKLRGLFTSAGYKPPMLPSAALRLMELTRNPDVSYAEIRRVLDTEPMLAGQVLARAQSAALAGAVPPRSLDEALTRLGLRAISDLFLYESLNSRVFRVRGYEAVMKQLMLHSSATATLARALGRQTAMPDEYLFLCGLLHDVGQAACLIAIADGRRNAPALAPLWPSIREVHAGAAGVLARQWKLPDDVVLVLEHHHSYRIDGRVHPVAALVALADELSRQLGFEVEGAEAARELDPLLEAVGLSSATVDRVVRGASSALEALRD